MNLEHIFENSEWHGDRMVRKQLNEAYNAMDELRVRVQVQASVINELKARLDVYERADVIARALVVAKDVLVAQETTINRQRFALERSRSPEPLQREPTVLLGGISGEMDQ